MLYFISFRKCTAIKVDYILGWTGRMAGMGQSSTEAQQAYDTFWPKVLVLRYIPVVKYIIIIFTG